MDPEPGNDSPLTNEDQLRAPFHAACKPRSAFRIGTEAEKIGLLADTLAPLPFSGPRSVQAVLQALCERHGFAPEREHERGEVISLSRGQQSLTLEPAGQLELSGAPHASVHETCRELRAHIRELREVSEPLGVEWLSLGFHPFARQAELPHVPKLRYAIMERYLPTRGPRGLDMMRRTCTVQANLDYASESDAMRKLRVALAIQPIATAMFANSPFFEGKRGSRLSERADVWIHMDPDRSGILPFAWHEDLGFDAYVQWALDVPMFLIKRGARVIDNTRQTFRTFLREGSQGERATLSDWTTHLNTLFPEARLKNTLEMRGVDAQPTDLVCAVPALFKGIFDDEQALRATEQLISPLDPTIVALARREIAERGLRARLGDRSLQRWAAELVAIARAGLDRLQVRNAAGQTESIHLARIEALLADNRTPAERLLAAVRPDGDFARQVVAAARA